ncbi:hypothetical protein N9O69_02565 [Alphaproteobacteria bacterium]|nr:hypothetical protein [Alphaproteobacteria bacterium]
MSPCFVRVSKSVAVAVTPSTIGILNLSLKIFVKFKITGLVIIIAFGLSSTIVLLISVSSFFTLDFYIVSMSNLGTSIDFNEMHL